MKRKIKIKNMQIFLDSLLLVVFALSLLVSISMKNLTNSFFSTICLLIWLSNLIIDIKTKRVYKSFDEMVGEYWSVGEVSGKVDKV